MNTVEINHQYECLKFIISMLQEGNKRGGLRLHQSHELYESISSFKESMEEADMKEKIVVFLKYIEEFQINGKWSIHDSFLLYLCISSFTNEIPHDVLNPMIEKFIISKKMKHI